MGNSNQHHFESIQLDLHRFPESRWLQRTPYEIHERGRYRGSDGECHQWVWNPKRGFLYHVERSVEVRPPLARIHNRTDLLFYVVLVCRPGEDHMHNVAKYLIKQIGDLLYLFPKI